MAQKILGDGITFDDVLLIPRRSGVLPSQVDTSTRLTRNVRINIPLVSAPMDTVTESALAIALAQEGGIGIIHKNMSVEDQAREVGQVKRSEAGVITDPIILRPDQPVADALRLMEKYHVSGFPVTEGGTREGRVVGILTRRDVKFATYSPRLAGGKVGKAEHGGTGVPPVHRPEACATAGEPHKRQAGGYMGDETVGDLMTAEHLVTGRPETKLEEAREILSRKKVEKLLLVDSQGRLTGLITMRDIENVEKHPLACRDERGRLRVGAAVGVHQYERVEALVEAEVDVLVVDTAHGHSENVLETVRQIKQRYEIDVIAGNIATAEAARDLIEAGADAVKVGIGPGSICTTRVVTGVGVPQISAIFSACSVADDANVPVIADGGVRSSGDIAKALAAGASSVMMGSLFGGLEESPGEVVIRRGRRYKTYRGMGSSGAMAAGSADRYAQHEAARGKYVPEGVEGLVPYRGRLDDFVFQMVGGVRAAMGYCGCSSIEELRSKAQFVRVTAASVVESHPHDILITREAPNYSIERAGMEE